MNIKTWAECTTVERIERVLNDAQEFVREAEVLEFEAEDNRAAAVKLRALAKRIEKGSDEKPSDIF